FVTYRLHGAKPAIALAIAATLVQVAVVLAKGKRLSPFFIVASGFTVLFGGVGPRVAHPLFFRFQPFVPTLIVGTGFLISVIWKLPLAEWFAAALPAMVRPRLDGSMRAYLSRLTLIWSLYFFVKSGLYLWLALRVDLGHLVLLRSLIGGATLALMFLG